MNEKKRIKGNTGKKRVNIKHWEHFQYFALSLSLDAY